MRTAPLRSRPYPRRAKLHSDRKTPLETAPTSISVIVAAPPGARHLALLETTDWKRASVVEILVARGYSPSRQRNSAAARARGDWLLFLDDDSSPSDDLVDTYVRLIKETPELAAAGGPSIYRAFSSREGTLTAGFTEPLVVGRSASRYAARGRRRRSDESELILSNMLVRRSAFETVGGFPETLYPNEENAFLERLAARGAEIYYEPAARVERPALGSLAVIMKKIFGYGRGRATQGRSGFSARTALRVTAAPALVLGGLTVGALTVWSIWPLVAIVSMVVVYVLILAARFRGRRRGWASAIGAAGTSVLMLASYAAGLLIGVVHPRRPHECEVTLERHGTGVREEHTETAVSRCMETTA